MTLYSSSGREKNVEDLARPTNRNNSAIQPVTVTPTYCDGTDCPAPGLDDRFEWCDKTREWYYGWAHSPQAKLFADTDWLHLEETALIHHRVWSDPTKLSPTATVNLFGELRRRVAVWGATYFDRVQLRMTIDTPQTRENAEKDVKQAAESAVNYLELLTKEVAEQKED